MNDLVAKRTLTKNSIINFIGNIIPLFLAFLVIPYIIEYFGKERFAILTIIWAIVGYFSFLDFGLSRTLTKMVSEKLGANKPQEISRIVSTTFIAIIFLGILGSLILLLLAPWLILEKFQISPYLRGETLSSVQIIAISIPFVLMAASLKGILIAYQKFLFINIQRIILGSVMFLSPLVISLFSQSLVPIIIILVLMRFIILLFLAQYSYKTLHSDLKRFEVRLSLLPEIFKFGGWLTITNVIGPIMSYFDRFLLGVWIPMIAVTYYVSPHEFVTKLLILPDSIMNVIFPAFSFIYQKSINKSLSLLSKSTKYIVAMMFPIIIFLITFSFNILHLWLGPDFADNSTLIMQILLIGIFLNSVGYVYFSFIQGIGKPHITAVSHMIQLPLYLIILWFLIKLYGGTGAALAWSIRIVLDSSILILIVSLLFKNKELVFKKFPFIIGISVLMLTLPIFLDGFILRSVYFIVTTTFYWILLWNYYFDSSDKSDVLRLLYFIKIY